MPSKKAIVVGLVTAAAFMFLYNRVPAVRKVLGGAA